MIKRRRELAEYPSCSVTVIGNGPICSGGWNAPVGEKRRGKAASSNHFGILRKENGIGNLDIELQAGPHSMGPVKRDSTTIHIAQMPEKTSFGLNNR